MEQPVEVDRPQDRYGAPRKRLPRRVQLSLAVGAIVLAVAFAAWLAYANQEPVAWSDRAYTVVDDSTTTVTFEVTMDPGTTAVCTVRALNAGFGEVGLVDVVVGPSTQHTVRAVATIPTSEKAVTGTVKACAVKGR